MDQNNPWKNEYFKMTGGFPESGTIREVSQYHGEKQVCIACTQLNGKEEQALFPDLVSFSEKDKKRILNEWISFLQCSPEALTGLHFTTKVPQALLDAACFQNDLEELRIKWGSYSDLSALRNLKKLKYLYIGPGAGVRDISVLGDLSQLTVLHLEGFQKIEDYSPLARLQSLEQLVITGPILGSSPMRDLEFLRQMPRLRSVLLANITVKKPYTRVEINQLCADLPGLYAIEDCLRKITKK